MRRRYLNGVRVRPEILVPKDAQMFKQVLQLATSDFWSRLLSIGFSVLGMGVDEITVRANARGAGGELSIEKLLQLGIRWPAEVDRVCSEQTRTEFLIADFLPTKTIAIAAGESTIGKSALICQLGLCVAAGVPFLGMPTKQARVLYFDLENPLWDCKTMRDSLVRHLGLAEAPQDFLLTQDPSIDLDKALGEARPDLVVIDSLRSFRPDVTDRNSVAGEWLQQIRKLSHKYDCAFLIAHHLRKPGENVPGALGDSTVSNWLQAMEGPRSFFNQTDVRIAIAEADGRASNPAALEMKWARRVYGDSPVVSLERVFSDEGEPLGYRNLTGPSMLDPMKRAVFESLGEEFSTLDAKTKRREHGLGDGNDPTNKYLAECKQLRIVEKLGRGRWRKLAG